MSASMLPESWQQALYKVLALLRFWKDESIEVSDRLAILERLMEGLGLRVESGDDDVGVVAESFV